MSNISGFRLRVPLVVFFAIMLLEGVLDIRAAQLDSRNGGTTAQEATGNGKVNQSSQSKTKEDPDKKKKKKFDLPGSIVAAPLPIVSPAIGAGIIPAVGYIFPFGKDDKISPPSTVGAAGLITNNGSSGFGLGAQLFMKENTYAITTLYVQGNVNYNLYGVGTAAGDANLKIPLDQTGHLYFGEALRRIPWQFFVGPRFWTGDSVVTVRPSNEETAAPPADLGLHTTLRALGLRLMRDTRPNHFYPTAGMFTQFTSDFFAKALGSKYTFQSYRFTFNKYWTVGKNQVLAYNLFSCNTGGDPPFYGNCVYGTNNELRGYEAGRYLDRYMIATQAEYRVSLPKKFGLAAFGGIGEVIPGGKEIFRINNVLPSIGGGPRFELSKKYHVNLRADFARGKDSWTWSMGVGEAF
jgi:Omp85 superfamily domain